MVIVFLFSARTPRRVSSGPAASPVASQLGRIDCLTSFLVAVSHSSSMVVAFRQSLAAFSCAGSPDEVRRVNKGQKLGYG